jgi:CheY-like chemotaxis protein
MATILIVDDRQTNRELLTILLGYRHHSTVEASDGIEGLERAREVQPDLIITDILMPTMDGYEFTRRLPGRAGGGGREGNRAGEIRAVRTWCCRM